MTGLKELGESAANAVFERIGRGVGHVQERKPLPYDLLESEDAYLVVFDAPGATRSDVQVRFLEGEVQVRIDRFRDFYEDFDMRFPGRGLALDGRAELPDDGVVDARAASATLTSRGTLHVRIPKDGEGHRVEVTEEGTETDVESETAGEPPADETGEGEAAAAEAADETDGGA
ncbi:MAG: Hsp20/alpha crystallin family protein [Haloferacaceae archaeon]